jgi:beta-mannosidase
MYRNSELPGDAVSEPMELGRHERRSLNVEALLGRFVDASWSYRFGPPQQNVIVLTLEEESGRLLSQAFRFPAGPPLVTESPEQLGLHGTITPTGPDTALLRATTRRLAYGVRVKIPGFSAADDAFSIEPGRQRVVALQRDPGGGQDEALRGHLSALNLHGRVMLETLPEGS